MVAQVERTTLRQELQQRFVAFDLPRQISIPLMNLVVKWYNCSGEEWTSDRLKSVKLEMIQVAAGEIPTAEWIKRRAGKLTGTLGSLQRWMSLSTSHFGKGIQALQCYTLFYAKGITPKQTAKFLGGVQSLPCTPELDCYGKQLIDQGWALLNSPTLPTLPHPKPLELMVPSPSKRAPLPGRSVPEVEGIIDSLQYLYGSTGGMKHFNKYYASHYQYVVRYLDGAFFNDAGRPYRRDADSDPPWQFDRRDDLLVGRIGLIQEPGYKLRAVANPGRVFQHVLKPLGEAIYNFLPSVPWDCTHDQTKAFPALQLHLSRGNMVHSIDLTGATDYFPLSLQEHLLKKMTNEATVNLFGDLSRGTWEFPKLGDVQWLRGQPLGLYPSFGAFALAHGMLLLGLLNRPWNDDFFVLGDDVVILNDQLASDYLAFMAVIGCPISHSKSLHSRVMCEFGGKIISSTRVIPQLKWRKVSDDSFLDLARLIGHRSLYLFQPRQRAVIEALAEVPDFMGGLGWNPTGKPIGDRLPIWLFDDKAPVDHLMGYSTVVMRNMYSSHLYRCTSFSNTGKSRYVGSGGALDQRASSLIAKYLPSVCCMPKKILGKNVDSVSDDIDLPINPGEGHGLLSSLLISWEAKLTIYSKRSATITA